MSTPTTFAWNTAWNMKDIQFSVYRSVDTKTNFVKLKDITSTTDTLWNYTTNDNAPEAGKTYYYLIKATKTGFKEFNTDTVSVTSLPTITLNGTLATTRWLVAILENHQNADGTVNVPAALQPFLGMKKFELV